jgi:hypothetical protein
MTSEGGEKVPVVSTTRPSHGSSGGVTDLVMITGRSLVDHPVER